MQDKNLDKYGLTKVINPNGQFLKSVILGLLLLALVFAGFGAGITIKNVSAATGGSNVGFDTGDIGGGGSGSGSSKIKTIRITISAKPTDANSLLSDVIIEISSSKNGSATITDNDNTLTIKTDRSSKTIRANSGVVGSKQYNFAFWSYNSSISSSGTITANYTEVTTCTVTWYTDNSLATFLNGSTTKKSTILKGLTIGSELPSKSDLSYPSDYIFKGWYASPTSSNQITSSTKVTGNTTYYAQWQRKYSVTYNANGGMIDGYNKSVHSDGPYLSGRYYDYMSYFTASRSGYKFEGWYNSQYGGTQVTSGFTINSNVTLYAHWESKKTLTINPYGGYYEGSASKNTNNRSFKGDTITLSTPTRTGYIFLGWTKVGAFAGSLKESNGTYTYTFGTLNDEIQASWLSEKVTVIWDTQSSYGKFSDGSYQKTTPVIRGNYVTLISNEPVSARQDANGDVYKFKGWYTSPSGGTQITNGSYLTTLTSPYNPRYETVTFYAQYYERKTLQYYSYNTSNSSEYKTITGFAGDTVNISYPVKYGYTFDKWSLAGAGSFTYDKANKIAKYTFTDYDSKAYATYNANTFWITFSSKKGSGSTTRVVAKYDNTATLTKNGFYYSGYVLYGWNEANSYFETSGRKYEDQQILTKAQINAIYEAHYTDSQNKDYNALRPYEYQLEAVWLKDQAYLPQTWARLISASSSYTSLTLTRIKPLGATLVKSVGKISSTSSTDWTFSSGICDIELYTLGNYAYLFSLGTIYAQESSFVMFSGLKSVTNITFDNFNTKYSTNMAYMFQNCSSLKTLDLSCFDTSKVTDLMGMFSGCSSLTSVNLSSFNTSNVTDMQSMFRNCSSLSNVSLSHFNTSKVTSMSGMFASSGIQNMDLSGFDLSKVQYFGNMFQYTSKLNSVNMSNVNAVKATYLATMFDNSSVKTVNMANFNAIRATELYHMFSNSGVQTVDLSNFNAISYDGYLIDTMFANCSDLKELNLSNFGSTKISSIAGMFDGCPNLTKLTMHAFAISTKSVDDSGQIMSKTLLSKTSPLVVTPITDKGYGNSSITDIKQAISGLKKLQYLDLSNFYAYSITDMSYMFSGFNALKTLDLTNFNRTSADKININTGGDQTTMSKQTFAKADIDITQYWTKVTNMQSMLYGCNSLTTLTLTGFATDKVTNMNSMFYGCSSLTNIDFTGFNTSKVTDMSYMFLACSSLKTLDISSFTCSNVANGNMKSMFYNCSSLTDLNMSGINASKQTVMPTNMLSGCTKLATLNMSNFGGDKIQSLEGAFMGLTSLKTLNLSNFGTTSLTNTASMFYGCKSLESIDFTKFSTNNVDTMEKMFYGCSSLKTLDLSSFTTDYSSIINYGNLDPRPAVMGWLYAGYADFYLTNMASMFNGCTNLTSVDISNLSTGSVTDMSYMFANCSSLKQIKTADKVRKNTGDSSGGEVLMSANAKINTRQAQLYEYSYTTYYYTGFDARSLTNALYMFKDCTSLEQLDLSGFGIENLTSINTMFSGCTGLKTLKLNNFGAYNVTSLNGAFDELTSLENLELSGFVYVSYCYSDGYKYSDGYIKDASSSITSLSGVFTSLNTLKTLNLSNFGGTNITSLEGVFSGLTNLKIVDLSNFDSKNVTSLKSMFQGCTNISSLKMEDFDTSKVTTMDSMFKESGVTDSMISSLFSDITDFSSLTTMANMFANCKNLTSVNFGTSANRYSCKTTSLKDISGMFANCVNITSASLSALDTKNVTNASNLFADCVNLIFANLLVDFSSLSNASGFFSNCANLKTIITPMTEKGLPTSITLPSEYTFFYQTTREPVGDAITSSTTRVAWILAGYRTTLNAQGGNIEQLSGWKYGGSGTDVATKTIFWNETSTDDLAFPTTTRTGYEFLGYFTYKEGGTKITQIQVPFVNATYYAQWDSLQKYTINFYTTSDTPFKTLSVRQSREYEMPNASEFELEGFVFKGWSEDKNTSVENTGENQISMGDKNWYAVWERSTTLTYHYIDSNGTLKSQQDKQTKVMAYNKTDKNTKYTIISLPNTTFEDSNKLTYVFQGFVDDQTSWTGMYGNRNDANVSAFKDFGYNEMSYMFYNMSFGDKYNYFTSDLDEVDLYAIYSAGVKLTYNINGGNQLTIDDQIAFANKRATTEIDTKYETVTLSTLTPTRLGYSFQGWSTNKDSKDVEYNPGDEYEMVKSVTMYAVWKANQYTLTINTNGGLYEGSKGLIELVGDYASTIKLSKISNYGYALSEYKLSKTNGDNGTFGIFNKDAGDFGAYTFGLGNDTLTIIWVAHTFTITYNGNANTSGEMSSQSVTFGEPLTLSKNLFKKTDYVCLGWSIDSTSKNAEFTDEQQFSAQQVQDLYSFLVQNGEPDSVNVGTYNLYAIWLYDEFTLTINVNGGIFIYNGETKTGIFTITGKSLSSYRLGENPTREGYTFEGWEFDSENSTFDANNHLFVFKTSDATLTATWKENDFILTFDKNSSTATGRVVPITVYYGKAQTLPANQFKRTGYAFQGWSLTAKGEVKYVNKQNLTVDHVTELYEIAKQQNSGITLYAVWDVAKFTIVFNPNGADGGETQSVQAVYDNDVTLTTNGYTKLGHKFSYWKKPQDDKTYYSDGKTLTAKEVNEIFEKYIEPNDLKVYNLYAVWTANYYTVTINPNGGTYEQKQDATTKKQEFGTTITLDTPIWEGRVFKGWTLEGSGTISGNAYTFGAGNDTLTAEWAFDTFTIVFNGNQADETSTTTSMEVSYNDQSVTLNANTFTKLGYSFKQWNTQDDDQGTAYANQKVLSADEIKQLYLLAIQNNNKFNLYAIWTINQYTLTINANGGTYKDSQDTTLVTQNYATLLEISIPTRTGYTFRSWILTKTGADGEGYGSFNADISTYTFGAGNDTLTAEWDINYYKVSYNATFNGGVFGNGNGYTDTASVAYNELVDLNTQNRFGTKIVDEYTWTFLGWNTDSSAKQPLESLVMETNDITLYAIYKITFTYTFVQISGEKQEVSADLFNNDTQGAITAGIVLQKDNYSIVGWGEKQNDVVNLTPTATSGAQILISENKTLYAIYSYEVTASYNANNGTGTMTDSVGTAYLTANGTDFDIIKAEITLKENQFVRNGYSFYMYTDASLDEQGNYVLLNAGDKVQLSSNAVYYVLWIANIYTITYDYNGGEIDSESENFGEYTVNADQQSLTLIAPTKSDGDFSSWTVVWLDQDHSSTLPTVENDKLTLPAGTYGNIKLVACYRDYQAKPTTIVRDLFYTGNSQSGVEYDQNGQYTISGDISAIDAGTYSVTFTLNKDYYWIDEEGYIDSNPITIEWKINPKNIYLEFDPLTFEYNAQSQHPTASANNSVANEIFSFEYVLEAVTGTLTDGKAINVGTYKITATPIISGGRENLDNYEFMYSSANFEITKAQIVVIEEQIKGTTTYGEQLTLSFVKNPEDALVTYQWYYADSLDSKNGTLIDGATDINYTIGTGLIGKYIYATISLTRENYNDNIIYVFAGSPVLQRDITFTADSKTKVYDATPLTSIDPIYASNLLVDGDTPECVNTSTITNVGSVDNIFDSIIIKNAKGDDITNNYNITQVKGTLTITPANIAFVAEDVVVTFDGQEHGINVVVSSPAQQDHQKENLTIMYSVENNGEYTLSQSPTQIDVVKDFVIYFQISAPNYNTTTGSAKLTIQKRNIVGSVNISGEYVYGSTLSAEYISGSQDLDETVVYNWQYSLNGTDWYDCIQNSHDSTFELTASNIGRETVVDSYLRVKVIGTDNYEGEIASEQPVGESTTIQKLESQVVLDPQLVTKVYDGTTSLSTRLVTATLASVLVEDESQAKLVVSKIEFDSADVGTDKVVTITLVASGNRIGNYSFDLVHTLSGEITKKISSIVLSEETNTVSYGSSVSFKFAYDGDGVINIQSDSQVVSVTQNENTISVQVIAYQDGITNIVLSATDGENYSAPQSVTYAITLAKREITLTSHDAVKLYDGTPLINHNTPTISGEGLATISEVKDTIAFEFTGSQTVSNMGSAGKNNTFSATIKQGEKDATDYYNITYVFGSLIVNRNRLTAPTQLVWSLTNPGTATWVESEDSLNTNLQYKVKLFTSPTGNAKVDIDEQLVTGSSVDFSSKIRSNGAGIYLFSITAISSDQSNINDSETEQSNSLFASQISVQTNTGLLSVDINGAITYLVIAGESFDLNSTLANGYEFAEWTVSSSQIISFDDANASGTNAKLLVTENLPTEITILPTATPIVYTITYKDTNKNGSPTSIIASLTPATYTIVDSGLLFPAYAKIGYTFHGWTVAESVGSWNEGDFIEPNYANYDGNYGNLILLVDAQIQSYDLTVEAKSNTLKNQSNFDSLNQGGTIQINNGVSQQEATDRIEYDSSVTLKATASEGYKFVGWFELDENGEIVKDENGKDKVLSKNYSYILTMDAKDSKYVAKFEVITHTSTTTIILISLLSVAAVISVVGTLVVYAEQRKRNRRRTIRKPLK